MKETRWNFFHKEMPANCKTCDVEKTNFFTSQKNPIISTLHITWASEMCSV